LKKIECAILNKKIRLSIFRDIKSSTILNLKNILGWKTNRKIVVFAIDDYGNVRLDSKVARENLDREGLKIFLRFDAYDSLENREDLEMLFETLCSVKDINGNHAKISAFAVPCNINYEKIIEDNYQSYHYELLPQTYEKLSSKYSASYDGAWNLWKEGISKGLLFPQFHGREHLNLKVFEEKLKWNDREILILLKNRSYTSISSTGYSTIDWSAAFNFWEFDENNNFESIIEDGLNAFEKVFGFRSVHFNPPGSFGHHIIHSFLNRNGIEYIDAPLIKKEHQGQGKYKTELNYTGKQNYLDMIYNVRNVVFEPTEEKGMDWVGFTLKQIEASFRWHRPAVISSHRVNYCGNISEENRKIGLSSLEKLLKEVLKRWPEVEFLSSVELMDIIREHQRHD
jgi:hypothetical protein